MPIKEIQRSMLTNTAPILVTGATGFIGSHLLYHLLSQNCSNLLAIRRPNSDMQRLADLEHHAAITWLEGDILDVPFLENIFERHAPQAVVHCAATVSFDPRDYAQMHLTNVEGTANLVNVALAFGGDALTRFIHLSSVAAIGRNDRERDITERNKWQHSPLNTHYAISKFQAEQEVWRGSVEGLRGVVVVNPTVVLGVQPWQSGTGRMFQQVWDGLRFYTAGATGFVDVRDVVRFLDLLLQTDVSEERFILNGENRSYQWLFERIAQHLGKSAPNIAVTPFLAAIAWRVEWLKSRFSGKRPLITRETARTSAHTFVYHADKSRAFFPNFEYTPIEKTLQDTADKFLLQTMRKTS
jgi:dihydroflavonol-4-reductase